MNKSKAAWPLIILLCLPGCRDAGEDAEDSTATPQAATDPKASSDYQQAVSQAWKVAQEANTSQAYTQFLEENPDSEFAAAARSGLVSATWTEAEAANTQNAYAEFVRLFPESDFAGEGEARSKDFVVRVVDQGKIDLSGGSTRNGPAIEVMPQWQLREARLNAESSYATNKQGKKVAMEFFIPIDLGGHTVKHGIVAGSVAPGSEAGIETWVPKINTFNTRYNAIGTSKHGQVEFVMEFADRQPPIKFGIIYESDYEDLATLHIFGHTINVGLEGEDVNDK